VLTRFKADGMLNAKTAAAWRDEVLSKGGGVDERSMVKTFLGRDPNNTAYFAYLREVAQPAGKAAPKKR
jgi:thimet oligopeptidase